MVLFSFGTHGLTKLNRLVKIIETAQAHDKTGGVHSTNFRGLLSRAKIVFDKAIKLFVLFSFKAIYYPFPLGSFLNWHNKTIAAIELAPL